MCLKFCTVLLCARAFWGERGLNFSHSWATFFPWLFKHYSKQILAHTYIRLVQLRLAWSRRSVCEVRFVLLESNVLMKSVLVWQGKVEVLWFLPWIFFLGTEWCRLHRVYEMSKWKILAEVATLARNVENAILQAVYSGKSCQYKGWCLEIWCNAAYNIVPLSGMSCMFLRWLWQPNFSSIG